MASSAHCGLLRCPFEICAEELAPFYGVLGL